MTALDYPIGFPFGTTSAPYTASSPHKGADYNAPYGTAVVVGSTPIGLTGDTGSYKGQTYDPHLHVQAGRDEWAQQAINPAPYAGKPGTVVKTGWGDQWGHYVCVRVGDVNVFYCHLSRIDVKKGQVTKGGVMVDDNITKRVYLATQDRDLDSEPKGQEVYDYWRGKPVTELLDQMYKDNELFRYKARHFVEPSETNSAAQKLAQIKQIIG